MIGQLKVSIKQLLGIKNITPSVLELKKQIGKLLSENPIIIEAGAHVGFDTVGLAEVWSKSTIYAFEPIPSIYKQLIKNTKYYKNIKPYNYALGETNERKKIHISSGDSDSSSSLLKPKEHLVIYPTVQFENEIEVSVINLGEWCLKNNINKIDLMWLDLQGYEFKVLESLGELISNVKVIYTEVNNVEFYEGTVIYKDLIDWLDKKGFTLHKEYIEGHFGEAIFINKKIAQN